MAGKILLDTNAVIDLFANVPWILEVYKNAEQVFVPNIVLGELYYGAYNSALIKQNISQIEKFVSAVAIVSTDKDTAEHYGKIKADLKKRGKPIPANDLWIAAIAM